ncbi:MAG: EamA family transporter [Armatimonadota bacterium]|nr:EamA family transporter [Armatimonadota bacterium]
MKVFWLAMLTAILWGITPVLDKLGLEKATPHAALTIRTIVIAVGLMVFLGASGSWSELVTIDRRSVMYIILGALAAGLIGQLVYYYALKAGEAAWVVPIAATYPLVTAAVAVVFLKEPITPGKIIGAVLIVLGVLVIRLDQVLWPR